LKESSGIAEHQNGEVNEAQTSQGFWQPLVVSFQRPKWLAQPKLRSTSAVGGRTKPFFDFGSLTTCKLMLSAWAACAGSWLYSL
jgi:hypothetical protein